MGIPLLSDAALARRLERAEAHANRAFVESRARVEPHVGAGWCDVDGTWAMFDGPGSPLSQSFGLGTWAAVSPQQLARLEAFFAERDTAAVHEVATTADMTVLPMLAARGYQPVEWSAVLCQPLEEQSLRHSPPHTALQVRRIAPHEAAHWADTSARGWSDTPELAAFVRGFARIAADARDTHAFLVEREGEAMAAGSLHLHQGVALLAGASTVPAHRSQGAQGALLAERLHFAWEQGADMAMMVAAPGSASQRNAQRAGFQVAYSRVKFQRAPGEG
jgi:hypothetical protein